MARFLDEFKAFMAKCWIVQPVNDNEYWENMLADFNALATKYEKHRLVMNFLVAFTSFQEAIAAGFVDKEDA